MFSAARLRISDRYEGRKRTYQQNEIKREGVLSCPTERAGDMVREKECGSDAVQVFDFWRVVRGPDGKLWAIVQPMEWADASVGEARRIQAGCSAVVELTDRIRRAGAVHMCDGDCVAHPRYLEMKQSAGVCDGGLYEVWTRKNGYPPHMG